jgi:hypothetical protein
MTVGGAISPPGSSLGRSKPSQMRSRAGEDDHFLNSPARSDSMTRRPYSNLPNHERRRQTELDAIDDAFRDVFPWKKLARQSGLVLSAMPVLTRMKRQHLTIGAWWSALIIFGAKWGDTLGDNEFISPVAIGVLKATCPFNSWIWTRPRLCSAAITSRTRRTSSSMARPRSIWSCAEARASAMNLAMSKSGLASTSQ